MILYFINFISFNRKLKKNLMQFFSRAFVRMGINVLIEVNIFSIQWNKWRCIFQQLHKILQSTFQITHEKEVIFFYVRELKIHGVSDNLNLTNGYCIRSSMLSARHFTFDFYFFCDSDSEFSEKYFPTFLFKRRLLFRIWN